MQAAKQASKIEGSPLLTGTQMPKPPTAHSTINLDKMDKARFSEMKESESENSSLRIIIYVLIVIVIGVGLALLVRQLISNQQSSETNPTSSQNPVSSPTVSSNSALVVNTNGVADVLATNVATNDDYVDSSLLTLGDSTVDMTKVSFDKIQYTDYETFSRMIFDLTSSAGKLPKVNLTYDPVKLTVTVEFVGIQNINSNLKQNLTIGSLVSGIKYDAATYKYTVSLTENFKYRVYADGGNLIVDFKTVKEIEKGTTAATPAPTPAPTTTPTPTTTNTSAPAAPHYTNTFGQDKQYVSSSVTTNSINFNNYYVWDEGSFFEFSWAEEGKLGDAYVPNADAYIDTVDGVSYLVVEVNDLATANLADGVTSDQVAAKSGITMAGANFVKLTRDSFDETTGKAVYRIELKHKADYQLLTQTTYDGKTQILSVQIKD